MIENDASYFGRRADEERAAASNAANDAAREAHLEMAERYERLAKTIGVSDPVVTARMAGQRA
jgi:hypothetical protein